MFENAKTCFQRPTQGEKTALKGQANGYGLALLMVFLASAVLLTTSLSLILAPSVSSFVGQRSLDDSAAKQLAEKALDLAQADMLTQQEAGTTITTAYRYPSSGTNPISMPTYPGSVASVTKGNYYVTATYARGFTFLLTANVTVDSNNVAVSRLIHLKWGTGASAAPTCSRPNDIVISRRTAGDYTGEMVGSQIGDVNHDGIEDFIIGANEASGGGTDRGEVYLVFGRCDSWNTFYDANANFSLASTSTAKKTVRFTGRINSQYLSYKYGLQVGSGDFNDDDIDDLLIGGGYQGESFIVFGRAQAGWDSLVDASGNLAFATAGKISEANDMIRFIGSSSKYVGGSITSAGDVNGDGIDDIIIGSGGDAGLVHIIMGRSMAGWDSLSAADGSINLTTAGVVSEANDMIQIAAGSSEQLGWQVSSAGDVDADGKDDILISAPKAGTSSAGYTYLLMGRSMGNWDALTADATGNIDLLTQTSLANKILVFQGNANYADYDGMPVANAGDVDKDGYGDILIGSMYDKTTADQDGAVYLIFGRPWSGGSTDWDDLASAAGAIPLLTKTTEANRIVMFTTRTGKGRLGSQVRSAGDLNNDTYDDIVFVQDDGCCSGAVDYDIVFGRSRASWEALTGANGRFSLNNISEANDMIRLGSQAASDYAGNIGSGDFNNDGYSDLILGTDYAEEVYIIFGRSMTDWDAITNASGYYSLAGLDP